MQMIVHVAVDRLPPYTDARAGDHHGLQSYVDELSELRPHFARQRIAASIFRRPRMRSRRRRLT
ncbi:MAG: hypothetical protein H0U97_23115, partial [Gammaproteobacteria bacterium]|nr:hypothetical protein [Gammaproteobacteria bacterium]